MDRLINAILDELESLGEFYSSNSRLFWLHYWTTALVLCSAIAFLGGFRSFFPDLMSPGLYIILGSAIFIGACIGALACSCFLTETLRCSPTNYVEASIGGLGARLGTDLEAGRVEVGSLSIDQHGSEPHFEASTCNIFTRLSLRAELLNEDGSRDAIGEEPNSLPPVELSTRLRNVITYLGITIGCLNNRRQPDQFSYSYLDSSSSSSPD